MKTEFPKWERHLITAAIVLAALLLWWVLCEVIRDYLTGTAIFLIVSLVICTRIVVARLNALIHMLSAEDAQKESKHPEK